MNRKSISCSPEEKRMMERIRKIFEEEIGNGICDGACVLSGHPGAEADFRMETGFAERGHLYPMTCRTVIDVASCTKAVVTVTALLIAHSRGQIDFDAPFTEYLPEYSGELKKTVRIRDLANHTSGFGDVPGERVRRYFDESGKKMLENVMRLPPPFAPTDHAIYACWNYILLCRILEHTAKMSLDEFAEKEIFIPLGMHASSLGKVRPSIPEKDLAQTTGTAKPGQISDFVAFRIFRDGGTTGNAGLFSTAEDLARLLTVYLRHGEGLFSEKSFAEVAPDRASHADGYRRFGWIIWDRYQHEESFGHALLHSGWSGQTVFLNCRTNRYTVVLTTRQGNYEQSKKDRFEVIRLLDH